MMLALVSNAQTPAHSKWPKVSISSSCQLSHALSQKWFLLTGIPNLRMLKSEVVLALLLKYPSSESPLKVPSREGPLSARSVLLAPLPLPKLTCACLAWPVLRHLPTSHNAFLARRATSIQSNEALAKSALHSRLHVATARMRVAILVSRLIKVPRHIAR